MPVLPALPAASAVAAAEAQFPVEGVVVELEIRPGHDGEQIMDADLRACVREENLGEIRLEPSVHRRRPDRVMAQDEDQVVVDRHTPCVRKLT